MTERLPTSGLGKLPVHGDYIRMHAGVPELAELDRWLQEGIPVAMQSFGRMADRAFDEAPTQRIAFGAFCGMWRASRDKVGRRFPLILGSRVEAPPTGEALVRMPLELERHAAALEGFVIADWADLAEFQKEIHQTVWMRDVEDSADRFRASLSRTAGDLWRAALGDASPDRRALLLFELHEVIHAASPGRFVVRVPCGPLPEDAAFFLELVRTWRNGDLAPSCITWGAGSLNLLFEPLLAKYFEPLHWPCREHANRYDLGHEREAPADRQAQANERFAGVVGDATSLADVLAGAG